VEEWHLDSIALLSIGDDDATELHRVTAATVMVDGTILIADAGNRRILRFSNVGEFLDSIGGRGPGPGELEWVNTVSALGDTVLAFDGAQNRVTVWEPGAVPRTVRLPVVENVLTEFYGALSVTTWILGTFEPTTRGASGLRNVYATVVAFDVPSREVTVLDRLRVRYEYHLAAEGLVTSSRLDFLGSSHIGVADGKWFAVPMDRPDIEVRDIRGGEESRVELPVEVGPYSPATWRKPMTDYLGKSGSGESRARLRSMYNGLEQVLADKMAPVASRALDMGGDLWVEMFARGLDGTAIWLVASPREGTVHAFIKVDDKTMLLGGTMHVAVVLRRNDLGEEIVEVHAERRAPPSPGGRHPTRN